MLLLLLLLLMMMMMSTASALHRKTLVSDAARELEKSKMARFDEKSGNLYVTELGRVASHFYIRHSSIVIYNDLLKRHMSEAEVWRHSLHTNSEPEQGTVQNNKSGARLCFPAQARAS